MGEMAAFGVYSAGSYLAGDSAKEKRDEQKETRS